MYFIYINIFLQTSCPCEKVLQKPSVQFKRTKNMQSHVLVMCAKNVHL